MAPESAKSLIVKASGPFARTYKCPFCGYYETFKKGPGAAKGQGFMGGGMVAKVAAHIRREHPAELDAA